MISQMKSRIPKFKSIEEERHFWQTHDITEFWDELTPVKLKFTTPRRKAISITLSPMEIHTLQDILVRLTGRRLHPSVLHSRK